MHRSKASQEGHLSELKLGLAPDAVEEWEQLDYFFCASRKHKSANDLLNPVVEPYPF